MRVFSTVHTEVRFASFLSGVFTTMAVINPQEKKLANRTSVHWVGKLIMNKTEKAIQPVAK